MSKNEIRIIHHFPCSGGALISKELSCMPNKCYETTLIKQGENDRKLKSKNQI